MRGIVLAGGTGSRLWPITKATSKQLLPVYDKPLVHYPIATLMQAGIRDIAIITTPEDHEAFVNLLGDGLRLGMKFSYLTQEKPLGIAHALLVAREFIANEKVALVLGDNLFHGEGFHKSLRNLIELNGAHIFAYKVADPERYGVIEFDAEGTAISLQEKPSLPKSRFAVPGLYFYDERVLGLTEKLVPSARGELEITSLNSAYLDMRELKVSVMDRGTAWLDTGTFDSLHDAGSYIRTLQDRQGLQIACLEEIAWRNGWITEDELKNYALNSKNEPQKNYLLRLLKD